ncbi:MAG: hypothetical protein H0V12_01505 [Chloroflexi bacterium]|nr:hypothetical protein [Chloroflexota bacterium]
MSWGPLHSSRIALPGDLMSAAQLEAGTPAGEAWGDASGEAERQWVPEHPPIRLALDPLLGETPDLAPSQVPAEGPAEPAVTEAAGQLTAPTPDVSSSSHADAAFAPEAQFEAHESASTASTLPEPPGERLTEPVPQPELGSTLFPHWTDEEQAPEPETDREHVAADAAPEPEAMAADHESPSESHPAPATDEPVAALELESLSGTGVSDVQHSVASEAHPLALPAESEVQGRPSDGDVLAAGEAPAEEQPVEVTEPERIVGAEPVHDSRTRDHETEDAPPVHVVDTSTEVTVGARAAAVAGRHDDIVEEILAAVKPQPLPDGPASQAESRAVEQTPPGAGHEASASDAEPEVIEGREALEAEAPSRKLPDPESSVRLLGRPDVTGSDVPETVAAEHAEQLPTGEDQIAAEPTAATVAPGPSSIEHLPTGPSPASGPDAGARPGPLVSAAWLLKHVDDRDLRVVHCSVERTTYDRRHLWDAPFADVHVDLAVRGRARETGDVEREWLLPDRLAVERMLGRWGIGPDDRVVFYDDIGLNRHAIRAYWLLRYYGWPRERVHVLDGGIASWDRARGELTAEAALPVRAGTVWLRDPDESLVATAQQVAGWSLESGHGGVACLLDVRTPEEYRGEDVRARRGGHIPGAVNVEWESFLTPEGTFRSAEEVRSVADRAAGGDASSIRATYCQGGVRAALAWFALHELAGLDSVRNYAHSWEEWGNRGDTAIREGPEA